MLFFFNATPTTEIYTLSLHDALPISSQTLLLVAGTREATIARDLARQLLEFRIAGRRRWRRCVGCVRDRKSTRLNSSHVEISYAVFCLKKKKKRCTRHHPLLAHK